MPQRTVSKPIVLSAFSGIGGLDLGLEAAGFSTIACIERDELARATLRANRPCWHLADPSDVTKLDLNSAAKFTYLKQDRVAVLAGGPPCQPFSKAAQWVARDKTGMHDPRAACIRAFLRLLKAYLPRVLLVENVRGFVEGRDSALPTIHRALRKINRECGTSYTVDYRVLNAADYGVPQRRERAILLALRNGRSFDWPTATHAGNPLRAWDALADVSSRTMPVATGKWADLLPSIPEGQNYLWHTPEGGGRPLFGYRTRYWSFLLKLAKDQPAWTLSAQPGPATGPFHWDNRPLAVQEMLRLQSFPETWNVRGDSRVQVLQVGNATPPLLAEIIARAIGEQVFGLSYDVLPRFHIARTRHVPAPAATCSVPHKYRHLEDDHPPHPGAGKGPSPVTPIEAA